MTAAQTILVNFSAKKNVPLRRPTWPLPTAARDLFAIVSMAAPASPLVHSRSYIGSLRQLVFFAACVGAASLQAAKWRPVDPAELADMTPQVDPEAGAEILSREVTIEHKAINEFVCDTYVRAKIFSARGLDHFAKIELPYSEGNPVREIAVRTIKPNGEIVELSRKDIYDRVVVKAGKIRVKVKSFSPAGLEPGAIVEYSYREHWGYWRWYVPMYFQSKLPARYVRYRFEPISGQELSMIAAHRLTVSAAYFQFPLQPLKADREGRFTFELRNVPAFEEEPDQPPELNSQSSVLLCYSLESQLEPKAHWANFARDLHERQEREAKVTKTIRATAAEIVGNATGDEDKLHKLHDFCRTKIVNRYSDASGLTPAQLEKLKANATAADTLKNGSGTSDDIAVLFVALARAAGFDARLARVNDRSFITFEARLKEPFMLSDLLTAVRLQGKWIYSDPGASYFPFGMVHWRNTQTAVIVAAKADAEIELLPAGNADQSEEIRTAKLQLDADGTLEGSVTMEYLGQCEAMMKYALDGMSAAERETYLREDLQEHLKLAELTEINVENATHSVAPLKISYRLRIPEYADRTGTRLFLQPAVFRKNVPARFTAPKRKNSLIFRFPYKETDIVRIKPPEGYVLEEGSAPESLGLGSVGDYKIQISLVKSSGEIIYRRAFTSKALQIEARFYDVLRTAFEEVQRRDSHTLTLKKAAPAAAENPAQAQPTRDTAAVANASTP
jgi:hypothetical protein